MGSSIGVRSTSATRRAGDWTYTIYAQWSGRELTFSYQRDHLPYVYFEVNKSFLDDRLSLTLSLLNPWGDDAHRYPLLLP